MKFARRAAALAMLLALSVSFAIAAVPAKPAPRTTAPAAKPAATHVQPAKPAAAPHAPAKAGDDVLDAVAAMVNDDPILVSEVEEGVYAYLQQSQMRPDSSQIDTLRRQVLEQIIDERLLQAEAKRQAITPTDAEIAKQVDAEIAGAKERIGGEEAYQAQLKRENITETQLRERYRNDLRKAMAVDRLKQKMFPLKPVPQAEAEAFFAAHKDRFPKVPAEVSLQVIQIPPVPDSAAVAAALAKAQGARKRILAGEKFAKVASEVSEDPGSKNSGGDLGFFTRGHMVKEFEDAAFSLPPGRVSEPVRSPFGWHLIEVIERDTVRTTTGADSLDENGAPLAEAHARHILVGLKPNDADAERAHGLALHVRDEARKGTNFATLVRRYSKYDGPADSTGSVGFVALSNLQPQIRAGLDTLEVGQVSDVLTNQAGFNIFRIADRHAEREYAVEDIRKELPNAVAELQRRDRYEAWMKTLRAKAQIDYR